MENYLRILTEIKIAISSDNVNTFKTLSALLNHVNSFENCETIWDYQLTALEKLGEINLICLACKSSSDEVLKYLFTQENCLYGFPFILQNSTLDPEVEDEECHNAFYYAIRSDVCNIVEILIEKWPNDPFKGNPDRLDKILAEAYKDLLVRNVCISKEMDLYMKDKLMDLRLFDDTPAQSNTALKQTDIQHLKNLTAARLDFVLKSIALVKDQLRESGPDELILLSLKYIAKNIHMLKSVIMSPVKLPWEEFEFCLVIYIRSCSRGLEKHPLYHFVLNGKRLFTHLEKISSILNAVKEKIQKARVNKNRKIFIKEIRMDENVSNCDELFRDFTIIRDLYSLETIKSSIDMAMSADASQKEGQLILTRALQVIGEHLKNTKDSPKLSDATNELLNSALPSDLRKIVSELRDCLSHAESLCLRSEIEESGQHFFASMQSDINQMNLVVNEIFCRKKNEIIRMTLTVHKDVQSMKFFMEENFLSPFVWKKELEEASSFGMGNIEELEKLVENVQRESDRELSRAKTLFRKIHDITRENDQSTSSTSKLTTLPAITREITEIFEEYENNVNRNGLICEKIYKFLQYKLLMKRLEFAKSALLMLKSFSDSSEIARLTSGLKFIEMRSTMKKENLEENEKLIADRVQFIDHISRYRREKVQKIQSVIHEEKCRVKTLQKNYQEAVTEFMATMYAIVGFDNEIKEEDITKTLTSSPDTDDFFKKTELLFASFFEQFCEEKFPKGDRISYAMLNLCEFLKLRMGKIKWIKEFKAILKQRQKRQFQKITGEISQDINILKDRLSIKIHSLRTLLKDCDLKDVSPENLQVCEKNSKLRSTLEMLMLDVTECLSDRFSHNPYFLDDDYPIMNGKNFRNQLAHGNALTEILFDNDVSNLLLNARKTVEEDLQKSDRKIGKKIKNDPKKSHDSHLKDLKAAKQQLALFAALSAGSVQEAEYCVRKGADMKGRSLNLWTTLHFAAKGPSLELVKLAIKFNPNVNAKDANLQTVLHISAAHGRLDTVQYLVEEIKMETNVRDINRKTALHLASQKGHATIVTFLLKHKADTASRDIFGYVPIHYAVEENHVDIVTILLDFEKEQSMEETIFGLSALHLAAIRGHLKLVETLLENKEPADIKPNARLSTLHCATIGGNVEVVKYLIAKRADVNAKNTNGTTSLHLAIGKCHDDIAVTLIDHGADVNAICLKVWTPLAIAAKRGNLKILKCLLESGANANVVTDTNKTPLEIAAKLDHYEIVKTLLCECKMNLKIRALLTAAFEGHRRIVELLLSDGNVDVNATGPSENKLTALHFASISGHADVVDILIKKRCNINAISECKEEDTNAVSWNKIFDELRSYACPDFSGLSKYLPQIKALHGQTALHVSCIEGHRNVVHCLIKNKADTSIKNASGFTPLEIMVRKGFTDIIIEENVTVSSNDCDDFNLLMLAAKKSDLRFVEYLLNEGFSINVKSEITGKTPLHSAIEVGSAEIVEYLLNRKADINARDKFGNTLLDLAVNRNRKDMVSILIDRNFPISDEIERRLLFKAVKEGLEDIVEYFLERNPNNGLANVQFSEYPLHNAVAFSYRNILKMLLDAGKGSGINDGNEDGVTPLYLAIERDCCEIVLFLLSNGADPNIPTKVGALPLNLAIYTGSIDIVKILINAKANIYLKDSKRHSALDLAVKLQNLDILKILLESPDIHTNFGVQEGKDLLWKAAVLGHFQTVKFLVQNGVDFNSLDSTGGMPIFRATMAGHQNIVEYFYSLGQDIHIRLRQKTLVHYAADGERSESVCEFLYKKGLDFDAIDKNGATPLVIALVYDRVDVFYALLHFGARYNARNRAFDRKKVPLEGESINYFLMMVSLELISHLFSVVSSNDVPKTEDLLSTALTLSKFGFANVRNSKNISLLHYATWKGHGDIVDILLKYKAKPNPDYVVNPEQSAKKEESPLHYASKFSHCRIVRALLSHGAIFNAVSDSGKTPLDYAKDPEISAIFNDLDIMFRKIQNGEAVFQISADMKNLETRRVFMGARNTDGATLLDLAVARDHPEAELLKTLLQTDVSESLNDADKY